MHDLVINNPARFWLSISNPLLLPIYFFIVDRSILWVFAFVITLLILLWLTKFQSEQLICRLENDILTFPTISRDIPISKIESLDVEPSKFMKHYTIKIHTTGINNDTFRLKFHNKLSLNKALEYFDNLGISRVKV